MKRNFTRAFMISLLAASVVSCTEESVQEQPNLAETSQLVAIQVGAAQKSDNSETRASYSANGEFSWDAGDKIAIGYYTPLSNGDRDEYSAILSTQENGKSVSFDGLIQPFEGEKKIYSCYYPNESRLDNAVEYNMDMGAGKILISDNYLTRSDGFITTSDSLAVETNTMGSLVAVSENATVESESTYNIPTFEFSQVASFFQVEILNHPADETIFGITLIPSRFVEQYINDEGTIKAEDMFFKSVVIVSMENGEIVEKKAAKSHIQFELDSRYDKSKPFLTMPLFPTTVDEPLSIILEVQADDGSCYAYSQEVCSSVEFKRNTIHRKRGVKWDYMTKHIYNQAITLDQFDDPDFLPNGTDWIINVEDDDKVLDAKEANNLRRALSRSELEPGIVQVELHGITAVGDNALCGDQTYDNRALGLLYLSEIDYLGNNAFANNANLTRINISNEGTVDDQGVYTPKYIQLGTGIFEGCSAMDNCNILATEYPERVFYGCSSLKGVTLYNVTSIGDSAFENCTSLYLNTYNPDLSKLTAPHIESIGARAFYNCTQIRTFNINQYTITNSDGSISGPVLSFIGEKAFFHDTTDGSSESYTSSVALYIPSALQDNVDYKTFTIGEESYEFSKAYVDGVLQTDDSSTSEGAGGSGEDANIETM